MLSHSSEPPARSINPSRILLGIIFAALAIRLWGVTNPLLDFHAWRQALTATVAYNFYADGMNILTPRFSMINTQLHSEFPLFTYLVALLYKVFGFHEIIGRLLAIAFSMGSIWFLYLLGKRYFDETAALVACGFYAVLPFSVYYSRTVMPESAMIFFSISMVYMFGRWLDTGKWSHFILALLLSTSAFLVKLPTLYMGGPLLFLAWNKFQRKIFYQPLLYLFVVAILIPPALWYSYVARLQFETFGGGNVWVGFLSDWKVLLTLRYWKLIFWTRLVEKMFAFTVFPFVIMGMRKLTTNKERYVLHTWFFSVCAFFVIAAKYNFIHEYYQVPIIPVGCLFAGKFIADFYRQNVSADWRSSPKVWIVLLMIIFVPIHSIYKLNDRLGYNDTFLTIAKDIKEHTRPGDMIIAHQRMVAPQIFYYGQRKGWGPIFDDKLDPATLTDYVNKGARMYIMVGGNPEETDPVLLDFLKSRHKFLKKDAMSTQFKLLPQ
jgi:4-amino-4-deoxy-L-arabinose transferase-like glycosyltransferase